MTLNLLNFPTELTCIHPFMESEPSLDVRSIKGLMLHSNITGGARLGSRGTIVALTLVKLQTGAAET